MIQIFNELQTETDNLKFIKNIEGESPQQYYYEFDGNFEIELLECPVCKNVLITEELASGQMLEVEKSLEDKWEVVQFMKMKIWLE